MDKTKENNIEELEELSKETRKEILEMIYRTKSPHIGCSFSMVELLVSLYFRILNINSDNPADKNRDRFVLSKGHGCPALYAVLIKKGIIDKEFLEGFAKENGTLEQHPTRNPNIGIEITSGSLGHGLSIGVGMALAAKYDNAPWRVFVFLGDGELNEGSNWEAMMFAKQHNLDNLVAIVDHNKLQAMEKSSEIINLEPLKAKWEAFGWNIKEVNGHNVEEIVSVLKNIPFEKGKPSCLVAHTIKGKGVSFMENEPRWHDKYPDDEEYQKALNELK